MAIKQKVKRSEAADKVLILSALDDFVFEKEAANLSPKTIANYKQSVGYFMDFHEYGADTTTDEVTSSDFYEWQHTMLLEGVAPSSVNHYLRDCRTFFYWCMAEEREYITPAFKIKMVEGQEEPLKMFEDEELEALLEKPKRNEGFASYRTWAIVSWVLATGNRASTICDVKIGDINFKHKEISLRHTKNKKTQIIPLSSGLEAVIKEYIRIWRSDADKDGWLFCNVGEEKLTTSALRQSFTKYCKDREVSRHNIHGLRHNFARGYIKSNGNMYGLKEILGHSTLEMTKKYVALFGSDFKEGFDNFSTLDIMKKSARRTQTVKRTR